jgi:hypothetical protein
LRHPELALRLTLNAHEEVKRYSWGTVRQQWLQLYRSLGVGEIVPGKVTPHNYVCTMEAMNSSSIAGTM